VLEAS